MKKAQPEIEKIQKKYNGKDTKEAQTMQAQEISIHTLLRMPGSFFYADYVENNSLNSIR